MTAYRVVTRWDGRVWMARVEDDHGFDCGTCKARRLEQIDPNVRALLERAVGDGCGGVDAVELVLEVQLHPDVELGFHDVADLVADASRAVDGIVERLLDTNMAAQDIAVLLSSRTLAAVPRRALVVPNTEVAAVGLDGYPDAIAVEWDDHGFGVTAYCRRCLEEDRALWHDLPNAVSALIYEGPVHCTRCDVMVHHEDRP